MRNCISLVSEFRLLINLQKAGLKVAGLCCLVMFAGMHLTESGMVNMVSLPKMAVLGTCLLFGIFGIYLVEIKGESTLQEIIVTASPNLGN